MNEHRFAIVTQSLNRLPSRRDALRGLVGAGLGLSAVRLPAVAARKRKQKNKDKKPKPNAFGCLNVGAACKNAGQCCSGNCEGQKGKRACRAHGAGTCNQAAPGMCTAPDPVGTLCNNSQTCACMRTTAGSSFCGTLLAPSNCAACGKDADCEALGFPLGSACVPFATGVCAGNCASGMVCAAPCGSMLPDPE